MLTLCASCIPRQVEALDIKHDALDWDKWSKGTGKVYMHVVDAFR